MNCDDAGVTVLLMTDALMQFTRLLCPPWIEARRFVERHPALMSDEVLDLLAEILAGIQQECDPSQWDAEVYWGLLRAALAREVLYRCREIGVEHAFREPTCAVFPGPVKKAGLFTAGKAQWVALDICSGEGLALSSPFPALVTNEAISMEGLDFYDVRKAFDDMVLDLESQGWKRICQFYPDHYWCGIYRRTL